MDESGLTVPVEIVIRPYDVDDDACIYATWRNAAFYGKAPKDRAEDSELYFKAKTLYIRILLHIAQVRIACLKDDPSTIIGYCVTREKILEWVYVKVEYRNKGIATLLVPKDTEMVSDSDITRIGADIVRRKNLKVFDGKIQNDAVS